MAMREGYTQTEAGRPEYGLVRESVFPCECLEVPAGVGWKSRVLLQQPRSVSTKGIKGLFARAVLLGSDGAYQEVCRAPEVCPQRELRSCTLYSTVAFGLLAGRVWFISVTHILLQSAIGRRQGVKKP